ncbi:MAG: hypothetical protein ACREUG_02530 [Steroidobacteraceae bacterium]
MRQSVALRICPLWNPPLAELERRAKERIFQARQLLADRAVEDHFTARVARNVAARQVRRSIRFLNREVLAS